MWQTWPPHGKAEIPAPALLGAAAAGDDPRRNYPHHPGALYKHLTAKGMKVSRPAVYGWFNPTCRWIEPEFLFPLCNILKVSARFMALGDRHMNAPATLSHDETELLEVFRALPEDARERWLAHGHDLLDLLNHAGAIRPFGGKTRP